MSESFNSSSLRDRLYREVNVSQNLKRVVST